MMTLQEFQAQHNLKDYLKNYDGYIIYTMTYFETSWSLLYSKYYTMTINMDAVRTEAEYIENVQQMFISFFFDWIPQLNYHYIKTEQLKVGSYGSSNKNSSKMSPIINNAKTSQDINDLPIMTANVMDNVDYDSLYQNAFSNKIVEKFYEAALDLFVSYTSNISFENGYTPIPPTIEVYFKDILGNYFDNVNLNTKFTSVDSAITALFQNDTTLQASKQNKLIQGNNITIDQTTNIISATGGSAPANWGNIGGTLSNQTDLNTALNAKVNITGDQTITGNKTIEKITTNEIYYNGAIKTLTFINTSQLAGYVDFIQTYKSGFKNYTGFRMLRDENGLLILGASILIDNRNALRIMSPIDDIWVMNTLSMQGNRIINLGLPTSNNDASNKKYVDDSVANTVKNDIANIFTQPQTVGDNNNNTVIAPGAIQLKSGSNDLLIQTNYVSEKVRLSAGTEDFAYLSDITGTDAKFKNGVDLNTIDYDAAQASSTNIWSSFRINIKFNAKADNSALTTLNTVLSEAINLKADTTAVINIQTTLTNAINLKADKTEILGAYIQKVRFTSPSLNWVASPIATPTPQVRKLSQIIDATLWADILANSDKYLFFFWPNAQRGTAPYTNNKPIICTLKGSGNYLFSTTWEWYNMVGNDISNDYEYKIYLECNRTDGTLYFVYNKIGSGSFPNNITMLYFDITKI